MNMPNQARTHAATIIFGPPASGKTRNADALAKHYGKTKIFDEGDVTPRMLALALKNPGALILTTDPMDGAIPIAEALAAACPAADPNKDCEHGR